MASKTEIGNLALSWLAQNLMLSIDDNTKQARAIRANFQFSLNAILEDGEWSFATSRFVLSTPNVNAPAWGYSYYFSMPSDQLKIIFANDRADETNYDFDYRVEKEGIACNSSTVYIKTVTAITDISKLSNTFNQALAARMGFDLAIPLTESRTKEADMFKLYENRLATALESDGSQGKHPRVASTAFNKSRGYGGFNR